MNVYVYFVGLMICATIFFYVGAKKWFGNSYSTKMYFVYLIGLITLLIGLFSHSVNAYSPLLNGGFENGTYQWDVRHGFFLDTSQFHSGNSSIRSETTFYNPDIDPTKGDARGMWISPSIKVYEGQTIIASAYIKTEESDCVDGLRIGIDFKNITGDGSPMRAVNGNFVEWNNNWTYTQINGTVRAGEQIITLWIQGRPYNCSGNGWFDDINLDIISKDTSSSNNSTYNFCNESGYNYCIINNYNNLSTKIIMNLIDEKGDNYQEFAYNGYAIKGFYAIINYDGDRLFYNPKLTNWDDECPNNNLPFCEGIIIENNEKKEIFLTLANIGEEYIDCPSFTTIKCDEKYCSWASIGYLKENNNDCAHIRVVECKEDNDCLEKQICNKNNLYNWRTWKCTNKSIEEKPIVDEPTNKDDYSTYDEPSSRSGYIPTYDASDASPVIFDVIIKIIHSIGSIFG